MLTTPLALGIIAPLALSFFGLASLAGPGRRPPLHRLVPLLGVVMMVAGAGLVAQLVINGPDTGSLGPVAIRIDLVSVSLFALVAFVASIVLGYSRVYLDGEARQGAFLGWMALVVASVLMLVTSGSLWQLGFSWLATSLFLHRLLLFYPDRPAARRAARKKFLFARLGDLLLLGAFIGLWTAFGTTEIAAINAAAGDTETSVWTILAAACLAGAAVLKSAQFPFHGWLTEVMEAPTPVSALLHAGVINAGGFLLIRFSDVMLLAPGVLAVLVMIGGFTALFAGLVMLTQPSVKTSLAWSTIAQMGFMILQCGLALFSLALLHIVAHSLYKAHAFLSSGGAVAHVTTIRRPGAIAVPSLRAVGMAFVAALVLYSLIGPGLGLADKSPQAIALGAILIFGVAYLLAQGFADKAPRALTAYTAAYSVAATLSYFILQTGAEKLSAGTLPATPAPGALEWTLIVLAVASFGLTAFAQSTFPLWSGHPTARGLRVHLTNGFYVNALTDRWLGNWSLKHTR